MNDAECDVGGIVAEEWKAALGIDSADDEDDFFALGGDSLRAVTMVQRLEERLGIEFPLETLFLDGSFGAVVKACEAAETP